MSNIRFSWIRWDVSIRCEHSGKKRRKRRRSRDRPDSRNRNTGGRRPRSEEGEIWLKKEKISLFRERCVLICRSNSVNSDNPTVHLSKAPSINNQYLMTVIIPTSHNKCNWFHPELLMQDMSRWALLIVPQIKKKKEEEEKEQENPFSK